MDVHSLSPLVLTHLPLLSILLSLVAQVVLMVAGLRATIAVPLLENQQVEAGLPKVL